MSESSFKFKQFTVWHDRCAMKVGTDGVLLGAWTPVENATRILDVGTGTGLIALQLAQRTEQISKQVVDVQNLSTRPLVHSSTIIAAIEIDPAAARQAAENVSRSPWADRINVVCQDFRNYVSAQKFDLIVSNPPYFMDALKCPDDKRRVARHTDELNYPLLFRRSSELLDEQGVLSVIVPATVEKTVIDAAWSSRLHPSRRCQVYTKSGKPCRRLLFTFGFQPVDCEEQTLIIESAPNQYSAEYIALTKDFYLKM